MLFADGELFCGSPFYTERRTHSPLRLHTARSPSTHVGAKRSAVPTCHSVMVRQQREKKVMKLTSVVAG